MPPSSGPSGSTAWIDGQHDRVAVADDPDVADQGLAEDREQLGAVVAAALAVAGDRGAGGRTRGRRGSWSYVSRQVACRHGPLPRRSDRTLLARSSPVPVALDRGSGVPLARQLARRVRDQVVAGSLPVGAAAAEHPRAGGRPRRLPQRHRAGLRPADRRGLARDPARLRDVRRRRRRPRARRHRRVAAAAEPDPGCSGSTPGPRGSTRVTGPPGAAPGATCRSRHASRGVRRPGRPAGAAGRARRPPGAHPRAHLRARRDPGDDRDHRRAAPGAGRPAGAVRWRTRTRATAPRPRPSARAAGRSATCRPRGRSTDLAGCVAAYVTPGAPAPARAGDVRGGPALACSPPHVAPARW